VGFADVDPDNGLLTPETLEQAIARAAAAGMPKPRAVLPVHLCGQSCDMDGIGEIARRHGLVVIEDAAHALGTIGTGPSAPTDPVGSNRSGGMTTFSFHPVKTVTTGEGGLVTTEDDGYATSLNLARSHGMDRDAHTQSDQAFAADGSPNPWYYEMAAPGFNYRLDDVACALGLAQLGKLPAFAARRAALAARYDALLAPLAPRIRTLKRQPWCTPVLHLYVTLIDFAAAGRDRAAVMAVLKARGIGTQVHYLPVHRQPYYRGLYGRLALPGADSYYERCLSLPLYPGMADSDPDRVIDALAEAIGA
jgi:dTDP-4-amino-4,6-dideoxygalactose transaminase